MNVLHLSCVQLPWWLPQVLWRGFEDGMTKYFWYEVILCITKTVLMGKVYQKLCFHINMH